MRIQLSPQCVINANAQFWEQMLAMKLEPLGSASEFCVGINHVLGYVILKGVWEGCIEVRMSAALAYQATAAMMMQSLDEVAEADVLDATKEIANMLAGTIKSSLPRPCSMTVPELAVQIDAFRCATSAQDSLVVGFRHAAGDLLVRVREK